MKFIHAADIHLDSPLKGLSAYPDAPVEKLRSATRAAFIRLVDAAIEHAVDFLIIAGDLYDGNWKDHNTGIFFCQQMGRLQRADIPVFLLYGNHDAESDMTKKLQLPANVQFFGARKAESFSVPGLPVVLHGQSFRQAATQDNLALNYPPAQAGLFNIGVLHTALEGFAQHANYAPCSLEQLRAKGYQYWALGHVHEYKLWQDGCTIVFPGNLQGRHIRETGAHGAVLVTLEQDGPDEPPQVERLLLDVLRWHHLTPDLSHCHSLAEVVASLRQGLQALLQSEDTELAHAVRISLQGSTPAHSHLFGQEAQLRAEALALVAALDSQRLWIEKVRIDTTDSQQGSDLRLRNDALAELQTILSSASSDAAFLKSLQDQLLPLVSKAPHELQAAQSDSGFEQALPLFDAIRQGQLAALVEEVHPRLITHLAHLE